jgi:hypothetical protein
MEVSLKNEAPGWLDEINDWLEKNTPDKIGFDVASVKVYMDREWIRVDDASIDIETGDTSIKGTIKYKTGPNAAVNILSPIEAEVDASVKYNVITKNLSKAILSKQTAIGEIRIDIKTIKEVLEGNWSAALNLIPNGGKVVRKIKSEYDDRKKWYQDQYGASNVYFASSDFVRWASPVTAGKYIVALIASGGSAAGAIISEVRAELRKEFAHILAWFESTGLANFQTIAQDFIDGKPITVPQLKLFWQKVTYSSTVVVAGQSLYSTPSINHAAFVLVWDKTNSSTITFDSAPARTAVDDSTLRPKWRIGARYALGPTGSRIVFVTPNGPALQAGLAVNDVIVKANGNVVGVADNTTDVIAQTLGKALNQDLTVELLSPPATNPVVHVKLAPVL